jgi:hypothetical protein
LSSVDWNDQGKKYQKINEDLVLRIGSIDKSKIIIETEKGKC